MNILLSAYACEPGQGSEPGVGWNVARVLADRHQVWVLTSGTHRDATEAELAREPLGNLHVVYFDPLRWTPDWSQRRPRGVYLHYYLWQVWAYFVARSLHRKVGFAVTHHVTYVKYSTPSFISVLPIPFFLGPVGGGEDAPKPFWQDFSPRAKRYELARRWARTIGEWDPFVRMTARRSAFAWATTAETAARLHRLGARQVAVTPESALDHDEAHALAQLPKPDPSPMRFISMGRLLHWKGFHLGLRAFAAARIADAEYWIVGDGPERESLEALARTIGIADQVKFFGALDRQAALARLGECHVLVHPSLHDSGSWVCLEAMGSGRPVICLALGGPAVRVTPDCGIAVSAQSPHQSVDDLAAAMTRLATDPGLQRRMGDAGQRRIDAYFSWDRRVDTALEEYKKALGAA